MNYLISIIVPVYNAEKYLEQCLDSLIHQTYPNIEIIVVNDGSTDNSSKIIEYYREKDKRIYVINQKNKGLSQARNEGVKIANGAFIMFVDSDDWINLETCNHLIQILYKNKNIDLIFWSYIKEYQNKITEEKYILSDSSNLQKISYKKLRLRLFGLTGSELKDPSNSNTLVTAWGKLYRTSYIKDNMLQFVDTNLIGTEDLLFNIQYFKYISEFYYLNKSLYHYRKENTSSLTNNFKPDLFKQWQLLHEMIENIIVTENLENIYKTALNNRKALSIIGLGLNILSSDYSVKRKINEIKMILSTPDYIRAYSQLTFKFFPLHWKVFFLFAKYQFAFGVFLLLKVIQKITRR